MKTGVILSIFLLLTGCALTGMIGQGPNYYYDRDGNYVEITDPPGQCVLYRYLGSQAAVYGKSLFVINYAALKKGIYEPDEALKELDTLEAEVNRPGATVGSVVNTLFIVASRASKIGAPELVLLTEGLDIYKGDMTPIDDCTWFKLMNHIGGQRNLTLAFQQ